MQVTGEQRNGQDYLHVSLVREPWNLRASYVPHKTVAGTSVKVGNSVSLTVDIQLLQPSLQSFHLSNDGHQSSYAAA
jgi:hypothetical protein